VAGVFRKVTKSDAPQEKNHRTTGREGKEEKKEEGRKGVANSSVSSQKEKKKEEGRRLEERERRKVAKAHCLAIIHQSHEYLLFFWRFETTKPFNDSWYELVYGVLY
jgi:hypothetical protein